MDAELATAIERLSNPGLQPVVAALAHRMGASDKPVASVEVTLNGSEQQAVADLLGLPRLPTSPATLRTDRISEAAGINPARLREVIEQIKGPLGDRSAQRQRNKNILDAASDRAAAAAERLGPNAVTWTHTALRTLAGSVDDRLRVVLAVVEALSAPPEPRRALPVVASDVLGDPHAFDEQGGRTALVAGAAAVLGVERPSSSVGQRTLLAHFGIICDEISSTVDVWRFPFPDGHPLAAHSQTMTDLGEPVPVTLSQLQRWPVGGFAEPLLVVENPSVLAHAAWSGYDRPLACSSGRASAACQTLISQAVDAGVEVRVHTDFDGGGFGIAAQFFALGGAPWSMDATDYLAALDQGVPAEQPTTTETLWDPQLAEAFNAHQIVIYEEALIDSILR